MKRVLFLAVAMTAIFALALVPAAAQTGTGTDTGTTGTDTGVTGGTDTGTTGTDTGTTGTETGTTGEDGGSNAGMWGLLGLLGLAGLMGRKRETEMTSRDRINRAA